MPGSDPLISNLTAILDLLSFSFSFMPGLSPQKQEGQEDGHAVLSSKQLDSNYGCDGGRAFVKCYNKNLHREPNKNPEEEKRLE